MTNNPVTPSTPEKRYYQRKTDRSYFRGSASQAAIAKKLGVYQVDVSRWLSGKHIPSEENLQKLAMVLGRNADELLLEIVQKRRERRAKSASPTDTTATLT